MAKASGGVNIYREHLGGMDAAGFESTEYFGFVISDLGQNQVLQIATALGPALRNALDETAEAEEAPALLASVRVVSHDQVKLEEDSFQLEVAK